MKRTHLTRSLTTMLLASATLAMPALANAQVFQNGRTVYEDCKRSDTNNQVVGGLLGAVAGGVLGSQIAGRGDRTEGSVIGAVLGTAAGAGIAGNQRNCTTESINAANAGPGFVTGPVVSNGAVVSNAPVYNNGTVIGSSPVYNSGATTTYTQAPVTQAPVYNQGQSRTVYTSPRVVTPTYNSPTYSQPVSSDIVYAGTTTVYGNNSGFDNRFDGRSHVKSAKLSQKALKRQRLDALDYEIDLLKDKRCILEEKYKYSFSPRVARRIQEIDYQIKLLKKERRAVKKNRIIGY